MSRFKLTTEIGSPTNGIGGAKFGSKGFTGGGILGTGSTEGAANPDTFLEDGRIARGATGGKMGTGTIETWVKRNGAPSGVEVLIGKAYFFWLGINTSGHIELHYGGGEASELVLTTSVSVVDNAWHHVAVDFHEGKPTIYIDGTSAGTSTSTQAVAEPSNPFGIGGLAPGGTGFDFGGELDEVALSTIRQYTANFTPPAEALSPSREGQIALYSFEGDSSGEANNSAAARGVIAPNDANVSYSPYNWDVTESRALSINPGAYLRVLVGGGVTRLEPEFDLSGVSSPLPQISYRIDGEAWVDAAIAGAIGISVPTDNSWSEHLLEIVIKSATETAERWEPQHTAVKLTGIAYVGGEGVTVPIQKKGLKVIVYGDSIVEGVRTRNKTAPNDTDANDATQGWAYRLTEALGAEVGVIGFGGTGISVGGSGGVPALPTSYKHLFGGGPERSLATPVPDAIVIDAGTNDGETNFTAAYITLINGLLAATPADTIVLCLRPLNGNGAAHVSAAVAGCTHPERVSYVDTTGWLAESDTSDGIHPYGYTGMAKLAQLLAAEIRKGFRNRGPLFVKATGTAVPLTPFRG